MLDEHLDERELAGRQVDRRVAVRERARREVELERPESQPALGRRRSGGQPLGLAAQHRVDARHELARVEGLRQVIVGAHLESDDAVDVFAFRRQHDDRNALARGAQATADRQAVLARQHEIEHDQMRRVALELPVDVARVGKRGHLEPLLGQVPRKQVPQPHVVVDDEYLRRGVLRDHG